MASIINFIYTSCIFLTHDNVYDVLEAAEYLRITSLKEYCRKFFKASLNEENCLKIRSYSNRYNMGDLVQAAETFISKNLGAVLKSGDFLQFDVDDVKAMLKLESVEDSIDEEKYRSAVAWALHDFDDRRKNFSDLFHLIQLENLSKDFLIKVVQKEKLVCNSTDCMQLLVTSLVSRISEAPACKAKPGQSDEILMIGGRNCERSFAKFNTKAIQWSNLPDTNIARRYPSAVNYNEQILLLGGSKGMTHYNSVEMLDLNEENPKWNSNLPSMGEKRCGFASTLLDGLLYALGGWDDNNTTNTAECYDPRNGKWEYIPPMKTCRYGLTAVVLNNEIYAIGGHDGSNYVSSVEKYNLDTKTWIDVSSINEKRNGGSACVVDGVIWMFGGWW
ncbi:unnamed protein product [Clavelina lepadiformis]|uniref:BACK domain-containing protein n=1 Tax=Clavelina lepadiformis TaxID=159417 RepID=A0ABP0G1V0_CLALP